jgi:RNA polymerase sigma-B factor
VTESQRYFASMPSDGRVSSGSGLGSDVGADHGPGTGPRSVPDRRSSPDRGRGEADLFIRWQSQRDKGARDELISRHMSLARKLASRYRGREPFEDLFQVACLGLVKAIDGFDPARGVAFSSYAVPTILGELKRHFRGKGYPVHLPRGLQELALKVKDANAVLATRTGNSPSVIEIAEYLSVTNEQVIEALDAIATRDAASLDESIAAEHAEDARTLHDTVGVEDEGYELVETSLSLAVASRQMSEQDRRVLALRFREELVQREIAQHIGVSQMQVSRILRRVTDQLAAELNLISPRPAAPAARDPAALDRRAVM